MVKCMGVGASLMHRSGIHARIRMDIIRIRMQCGWIVDDRDG